MTLEDLHKKAANEDSFAMVFLNLWSEYCHDIDDLIDEKKHDAETLCKLLILANVLYSTHFYVNHATALKLVVLNITNAYADSVKWDKAGDWQGKWADTLRFAGAEMVTAVAMITGGYDLVRQISPLLREVNWKIQHEQPEPK